MRNPEGLERLITQLESASVLDRPAAALAGVLRRVLPPGPVEDGLSGTPLGHPLHPVLVSVPIGAWVSATLLDLLGEPKAARTLTGAGVLAALPTAATGASDWLSTSGAERRVGLVHAAANYTALTAYSLSWRARRSGGRGLLWSAVGGAALAVGGWLGGHLAYAQGVGVDTTAFLQFPADWTDAGDVPPADGRPHLVSAGGVPVLVVSRADGWTAFADRCTHRGGPLHEGKVRGDTIVCPWHDSAFSLADGSVCAGPATRPQPLLEVRTKDGRLLLRRTEERALRTNPM